MDIFLITAFIIGILFILFILYILFFDLVFDNLKKFKNDNGEEKLHNNINTSELNYRHVIFLVISIVLAINIFFFEDKDNKIYDDFCDFEFYTNIGDIKPKRSNNKHSDILCLTDYIELGGSYNFIDNNNIAYYVLKPKKNYYTKIYLVLNVNNLNYKSRDKDNLILFGNVLSRLIANKDLDHNIKNAINKEKYIRINYKNYYIEVEKKGWGGSSEYEIHLNFYIKN